MFAGREVLIININLVAMTDKEKVSELISSYPLYKKIEVDRSEFDNPDDFNDLTFSFYCPNEKNKQTFKLKLEPSNFIEFVGNTLTKNQYRNKFDTWDSELSKNRFTQHYSATCEYCKMYKAHFVIQLETNMPIPINPHHDDAKKPKQIMQKIGQYPPYDITPDKNLINFFNEEDQNNYRKALICRSQNYGIAAFAYLRRIVENEIVKIIEDISKVDRPESKEIKTLLEEFDQNHIMTKLIDGVYPYIPNSLKDFGNNPLKVLHGQLSGGIHEFSEEKCSEKADQIDTLLKFVIKRIKEENSEVKAVREAMKGLV